MGQPTSDKTKYRMKKKVPVNFLKIFGGTELLLKIKLLNQFNKGGSSESVQNLPTENEQIQYKGQ